MTLTNTTERWGSVSKLLHWLVAALILLQFWLAWRAETLPLGMAKLITLARHKSVGLTILALVLLRLAWRLAHRGRSPSLPQGTPRLERILALLTHQGLYVLLVAQPLVGWAMTSAKNYPVSWFNRFELPNFVPPSETLFEFFLRLHAILGWALAAVAALHIAAALVHHFVRRDDILLRMLPFGRLRNPRQPTGTPPQ